MRSLNRFDACIGDFPKIGRSSRTRKLIAAAWHRLDLCARRYRVPL